MVVHAGQLSAKVSIATLQMVPDGTNGKTIPQYSDLYEVYAEIIPESEMPFLWQQNAKMNGHTHAIRFRFRDFQRLNTNMRILYTRIASDGSRYTEEYKIHGVKELDRRQFFVEVSAEMIRHI